MNANWIVFVCVLLISLDCEAFFLIKALKKALFCSKVCYLYCKPKKDHVVDIHHYHSIDIPYYKEHYYEIPEPHTPKPKEKPRSMEPTYEDFLNFLAFYREFKQHEVTTTEKPKTKETYYYGHYDRPENIETTTPYIYKDLYYKEHFYPSYNKRETTTEMSKDYLHYLDEDDVPHEYYTSDVHSPKKTKRDIKYGYYYDIHHKHHFWDKPEVKEETKPTTEEPSGICMFCMKKCHYPKPPD